MLERSESTRRGLLLVALLLSACGVPPGTNQAPPTPLPEAGVSGAPLAGHLEVHVVDDVTGEPIAAQVGVTIADGTRIEIPAGTTMLDDPRLVPPIALEVALPQRSQRWENMAGSVVVLGVAGGLTHSLTGRVDLPSTAPTEVTIRTLQPARLWRTTVFDRADGVDCSQFDGCVFTLRTLETASGAAVVLRDGETTVGLTLARDVTPVDARQARTRIESADIALPTPPAGLTEVVGVPGVVVGDHIALLGYTTAGHFAVPDTGDAFWLLARAQSATRETTVLQHGLHSLADAGAWPGWLEGPAIVDASAEVVHVTAPSGATVLIVDWLSGMDAIGSVVVLAPAGPLEVWAPETTFPPNGARVRALDVTGVTSLALDLTTFDAHVQRYADQTLTF